MNKNNKCYTPFVDSVLKYYAAGHSGRETADQFGVTLYQVQYWAKIRRVSNGRTFKQGGQESNAKRHLRIIPVGDTTKASQVKSERARERWTSVLIDRGFLLLEWRGKSSNVTLRCLKCGSEFERRADNIRKGVNCPRCLENARRLKQEEQELAKRVKQEARQAEQKTRREQIRKEHANRMNEKHTCKVCGKNYTIAEYMKSTGMNYGRNSGFCSRECRDEYKRICDHTNRRRAREEGRQDNCKHYSRAKKRGLPVERGITLKKLIERNGDTCAICGLPCYYFGDSRSDLYPSIDHIIPLGNDPDKRGGHTWANVQVAHRICNSNKRNLVGKEWNNDKG